MYPFSLYFKYKDTFFTNCCYIHKYDLLTSNNIICMYVFREEHLSSWILECVIILSELILSHNLCKADILLSALHLEMFMRNKETQNSRHRIYTWCCSNLASTVRNVLSVSKNTLTENTGIDCIQGLSQ